MQFRAVRQWGGGERWRTVMRDVVSVPVLSEQMVVAPPMVSHALRCRTCAPPRNAAPRRREGPPS